ncbi:hypothetical protein, partial [Escherichia coli]|uniref:hypothetical protein n=1 Tax=Escherichia coli TaxID=562 RepID=UPI0013DFD3DA
MSKVELVKKVIEAKKNEVMEPVVYSGRIENSRWIAESLHDKYNDIVRVVEVEEDQEPAKVIDEYEFIGGNTNRLVYVHRNVINKWLETANHDSHWAAAAVLRPGKLARSQVVIDWSDYRRDEADEGLLAILKREDWRALVKAFELPEDTKWMQVTIFDLGKGVSAKGTLRVTLHGEKPTVYPNSWKRFGNLRTEFMAVLTVDAVYRPRASINVQELQYWTRNKTVAEWVWDALGEEIQRILEYRTTPWTTTGYLQALGFSPAWNITVASLKEHLTGELQKLLRRIKLSAKYGMRAKTSSSNLLKESEVLLPEEAKKYTKVGSVVWIGRNPALPSQGWGRYKVAGFHNGNFVVFALGDKQWSGLLGGDHDGDDCVVFYREPVEGYTVPEGWLNLQAVKPTGRKLEGNSVEERLTRWKNEVSVNIGQFDLAARRLLAINRLDEDGRKLFTIAIQTVISLRKRVAKLEEQPWYPLLQEQMELAQQVAGSTWVDSLREGCKPYSGPEWAIKLWTTVTEAIAKVNKLQPRIWLTPEKVKAFSKDAKPEDLWVHNYLQHLKALKTQALMEDDGQTVWEINREIREFVHVRAPEYLMELPEDEWKEFSRWAIGNMHSSEWVFWCHPDVLEEWYQAFAKETRVAICR